MSCKQMLAHANRGLQFKMLTFSSKKMIVETKEIQNFTLIEFG